MKKVYSSTYGTPHCNLIVRSAFGAPTINSTNENKTILSVLMSIGSKFSKNKSMIVAMLIVVIEIFAKEPMLTKDPKNNSKIIKNIGK